jgi:hypothetical protein
MINNRLCPELLAGLQPQSMLLADRGYDADWIRALVSQQGAWANIPPKRNRKEPICFGPVLRATSSNGPSTGSSNVGVSRPDTTSSRLTIWPSSRINPHLAAR